MHCAGQSQDTAGQTTVTCAGLSAVCRAVKDCTVSCLAESAVAFSVFRKSLQRLKIALQRNVFFAILQRSISFGSDVKLVILRMFDQTGAGAGVKQANVFLVW